MHFHSTILSFGFLICLNLVKHHVEGEPSPVPADRVAQGIASLGRKLITFLESDSAPNENLLISPANIFHAVAMVHMAAGGNTLTELSNLMEVPLNQNYSKSDFHSAVSTFYKGITTNDTKNPVIVNIADAFFVQNDFLIKEDYRNNIIKQYQAKIENVNFRAGNEAAEKINNWVSEETRNRIKKIVDRLGPDTKAVIASTLYFKAKWAHPFKKDNTRKGKFSTAGGQADVQMMTLEERLPYVNNAELQFESIDLPYADSNYALNIILPYAYQTIKNLIPKLKDISIHQVMGNNEITHVDVRLPKTKFNVGKSLITIFKRLGVQDLFTDKADLSDLTDAKLQVSEILHNAEIEIQEAGTVATAATDVQFYLKSYRPTPRKSVLFNVNRPFIINIYNKKTSLNLFSGIVYKPEFTPSIISRV